MNMEDYVRKTSYNFILDLNKIKDRLIHLTILKY